MGEKIARRAQDAARKLRFRASLRHLHGPKRFETASSDVVVIALVRDGLFYMEQFLSYYRSLGVKGFVFCDNGSTDGTIQRLSEEADVIVLRSDIPWGAVENDFRRHAAQTYAAGCWALIVDMDEIFEFPGQDAVGLSGLIAYLDQGGHTALVAQMLEMFPEDPILEAGGWPYDRVLDQFTFYDLSDVSSYRYHNARDVGFSYFLKDNVVSNPEVGIKFGGVRRKVFGENCCLTKHVLVKVVGGVIPGLHPHCSSFVSVAAFTALIKHYKFSNDPAARDHDSLIRAAIPHGEDRARLARFEKNRHLSLFSVEARAYRGLADLQETGFLVRCQDYEAFCEDPRVLPK